MERTKPNKMIRILLSLLVLLGVSDMLFSKTDVSSDPEGFLILLETTDNEIKLTGWQGCAFRELNYALKDSVKRTVDQYGKVNLVRFSTKGIPKEGLANFQFTVMRTEEGFYLKGIHGTTWEELSVTYPDGTKHHFIDQNGIVEPRPLAMTD
jgi:hypothetical protein